MVNLFNDSNNLKEIYIKNGFTKGVVVDVLSDFVLSYNFIEILKRFLSENVIRRDTIGVVYADEYEPDEEGYFGEDKVLFYYYYGLDEIVEDVVTHEELCAYLEITCNFYSEKYPEKKIEAKNLLKQIKEKYKIKES